jgi:hypothetical protein
LVNTICPFAVIRPAIADGSGPVTRFSVTALAFGWSNVTVCALPTLKLVQLTAARALDWVMVVVVGAVVMLAAPATTWPPSGRADGAGWAIAGRLITRVKAACNAVAQCNAERLRSLVPTIRTTGLAIDGPLRRDEAVKIWQARANTPHRP